MTLSKVFFIVSASLFSIIGCVALCKNRHAGSVGETKIVAQEEVDLSRLVENLQPVAEPPLQLAVAKDPVVETQREEEKPVVIEHDPVENGLDMLFVKGSSCPIVETVTYKRHVPWKSHSAAWLADYAHHYKTPLDFIYRSLNAGKEYTPTTVSDGARFNVLKKGIDFRFHLIVSISSCRLRLYYVIPEEKKAVFLKSYQVCLGKKDSSKSSECLTPLGMYQLGDRIAVFKPKMMGMHKGKKIELIQVFGGYWIPFEKALGDCSEPAKGFGIHGTPIHRDAATGTLQEDNSSIGHFESDGCIRLAGKDMQELYSIISTHKTYVELVTSFDQSKLFQGEIVNQENS